MMRLRNCSTGIVEGLEWRWVSVVLGLVGAEEEEVGVCRLQHRIEGCRYRELILTRKKSICILLRMRKGWGLWIWKMGKGWLLLRKEEVV